jgi:anti-anti-sigma factor
MTGREPLVLIFEKSEWDIAGREDFAKLLEPAYSHSNVILDLSPVTYIDSSCLGELAKMRTERAKRNFPPARLVVVSPHVRRVFKIVQFDRIWPLYDSLDAALYVA